MRFYNGSKRIYSPGLQRHLHPLVNIFDKICTLEFGSWTYDRTQLELDWWVSSTSPIPMAYVDFVDYVPSNEWRTDGEAEKDIVHTNRTKQVSSKAIDAFTL